MAIVDKIHDLTKKMTGQDGVGSDITTAINDLTAKWTQSDGKGSNIEESIANLSLNASSGGGGGYPIFTVTYVGDTPPYRTGSCNMTYGEVKNYISDYGVIVHDHKTVPCIYDYYEQREVADCYVFAVTEEIASYFFTIEDGTPMDSTVVTEAISISYGACALGNDGNLYLGNL